MTGKARLQPLVPGLRLNLYSGLWEQRLLSESHLVAKSSAVPGFSLAATRRPRTSQSSTSDRAASDLLPKQNRLSFLCWNLGPKRGSPGASGQRARCRAVANFFVARIHLVLYQRLQKEETDPCCPFPSGAPLFSTKSGLNSTSR